MNGDCGASGEHGRCSGSPNCLRDSLLQHHDDMAGRVSFVSGHQIHEPGWLAADSGVLRINVAEVVRLRPSEVSRLQLQLKKLRA